MFKTFLLYYLQILFKSFLKNNLTYYQLLILSVKLLIDLIRCVWIDAIQFILKIFCDLIYKFRGSIFFTWKMIFLLTPIHLKILLTWVALAAINICDVESWCSFKTTRINSKVDWWTVKLRWHFMELAFVHFISVKELPTVLAFHILKKDPELHKYCFPTGFHFLH